MVEESRPPLSQIPTGRSETSCSFNDCSNRPPSSSQAPSTDPGTLATAKGGTYEQLLHSPFRHSRRCPGMSLIMPSPKVRGPGNVFRLKKQVKPQKPNVRPTARVKREPFQSKPK